MRRFRRGTTIAKTLDMMERKGRLIKTHSEVAKRLRTLESAWVAFETIGCVLYRRTCALDGLIYASIIDPRRVCDGRYSLWLAFKDARAALENTKRPIFTALEDVGKFDLECLASQEIAACYSEANELESQFHSVLCQFRWSLPLIGAALPFNHLDPRTFSRPSINHVLHTHTAHTARFHAEFFPITERAAALQKRLLTNPHLSACFGPNWSTEDASSLEHGNGLGCLATLRSFKASTELFAVLHDR